MQGVSINDASGRRVLSTHFPHPLRAALAVAAALSSSDSIVWVPSLDGEYNGAGNESSDEDEDGQSERQPWASTSRRAGGQAVCQIERNGLRYVAPISTDVDPVLPLSFLHQLHEVLESYVGGPVTEASLKDNFDIVLALLEEMLASGRPLLSQTSQLRELVLPPSQLLAKVALNAANVAGLSVATQSTANALLTSPLPWRRQGIKYTSNEIYFDVMESLDFVLDKNGRILSGGITGDVSSRSRLSGMPDLTLSFSDPSQLEDCAFHSSVRYGRWNKDKVVSFVPPDGAFSLMRYQVGGLAKATLTSSAASAIALLPISITSTITQGTQGGAFTITLTSRAPSSRSLTNIRVRLPLSKGANGVTASVTGGGFERDQNGKVIGNGAGVWDVGSSEGSEGPVLSWTVGELASTDRPAVLQGQYYSAPGARAPSAFLVTFDSQQSGFSGLRIASLKVSGEQYSIYKGVRLKGRGSIEVRCV